MAIVYRHRRKDTGEVFYIGIGKDNRRSYATDGRNKYWRNVVNKAGGYHIDILFSDCSPEEAKLIEIDLISFYGRADLRLGPLVNMTDGGDGSFGMVTPPEVIEKIRIGNIGKKKPQSIETIRKIAESRRLSLEQLVTKFGEEEGARRYYINNPGTSPLSVTNPKCKDTVWIHNDTTNKRVPKDKVNSFIEAEWKMGRRHNK